MHPGSTYEDVAELRAHSAAAHLVVISGSVAQSAELAVDAWLRKPFELEDVLRALRNT